MHATFAMKYESNLILGSPTSRTPTCKIIRYEMLYNYRKLLTHRQYSMQASQRE